MLGDNAVMKSKVMKGVLNRRTARPATLTFYLAQIQHDGINACRCLTHNNCRSLSILLACFCPKAVSRGVTGERPAL
eukprot:5872745-Pleurochrysis_carterae.AAC.2